MNLIESLSEISHQHELLIFHRPAGTNFKVWHMSNHEHICGKKIPAGRTQHLVSTTKSGDCFQEMVSSTSRCGGATLVQKPMINKQNQATIVNMCKPPYEAASTITHHQLRKYQTRNWQQLHPQLVGRQTSVGSAAARARNCPCLGTSSMVTPGYRLPTHHSRYGWFSGSWSCYWLAQPLPSTNIHAMVLFIIATTCPPS